jgi:glycopeptide antibiotics resistance protein
VYFLNGNFVIVLGVISYIVLKGVMFKVKKQYPIRLLNEVTRFLFFIYSFMVVSVTLFPLPIGFPLNFENLSHYINVVPLVSILKQVSQIGVAYDGDVIFMMGLITRNVGGNILLFIPLGFLVPKLWDYFKRLKNVFLLGLGVSISIEILQLFESLVGGWGRVTDIDDVICNVIGVVLGYYMYKWTLHLSEKHQIKGLKKFIA